MKRNISAKTIEINGIVQGVGFRPFIFQLANQHGLKGEVSNTSAGVTIHVEGDDNGVRSFCMDIPRHKPPRSKIIQIKENPDRFRGYHIFSIARSRASGFQTTLISPDIAVCDECLKELLDPNDRRYQYPFINCTNCGPRYTIVDHIPYDRKNTTMRHFNMCRECKTEYENPFDRRFHAQPNACPKCGPHVSLWNNSENEISSADPIQETAALLKNGAIVAIKGLGGFHLAVNADNNDAVLRLRQKKYREEKPFALMAPNLDAVHGLAHFDDKEKMLLTSIERPIVILKKKDPISISHAVAPGNPYLGIMLPYTPLHYLLFEHGLETLVMTSGNISEEPIAVHNQEAFERLANVADYFLIHNRDINLRCDDAIVKNIANETRVLRRSRGFVPVPILLAHKGPGILACGADLKNTVCLTKDNYAFMSQHMGDMENYEAFKFFEKTIQHMEQILDIQPEIIACDLHPDYMSSGFARDQSNARVIPIQHHHAHIAACMAENKIHGPVIGLAFDGTGYGEDGAIWGGEIMISDLHAFERAAHLQYIPMPGNAMAVRETWRMAISYLYDAFGEKLLELDLPLLTQLDSEKIHITLEMIKKGFNSPLTSSLGRLFDGIASIIGIRNHVTFEGQAAIALEMTAQKAFDANQKISSYPCEWEESDSIIIKPCKIIRGVIKDMNGGKNISLIAAKFHQTLIKLFSELCDVIKVKTKHNRVVLSGGVFQNSIMLKGLTESLQKNGFDVFSHKIVPTNDGGISLGQAVVARAIDKNNMKHLS